MKRYLFVLPVAAFLVVIIIIPFVQIFRLSFQDYRLAMSVKLGQWVGLQNYKDCLANPDFWHSIRLTLWFVFLVVFLETILGLAVALLLNQLIKGRNIITSLVLLPSMIAPVVVAVIWTLLLAPYGGMLLYYLSFLRLVKDQSVFAHGRGVFYILVGIDVWQWFPFVALILLAGLTSLPVEPYEAAMVDGVNKWQGFWHVTLPLLSPVIVVAVILRTIEALMVFEKMYVLTFGGPGNTTEISNLYVYRTNFVHWDFGKGATEIIFLLLISIVIIFILLKIHSLFSETW